MKLLMEQLHLTNALQLDERPILIITDEMNWGSENVVLKLKSEIIGDANILKANIGWNDYKMIVLEVGEPWEATETSHKIDENMLLRTVFQLIKEIRLVCKAPLVLAGRIPTKTVLKKDAEKLLYKSGFYYYNLGEKRYLEISPISDLLWHDLQYYVCSQKGLLNELWHGIKDIIGKSDYKQIIETGFDNLKNLFKKELQDEIQLQHIKSNVLKELDMSSDHRKVLNHYRSPLFRCFNFPDTESSENSSLLPVEWEVLYLDDNAQETELLTERFQRAGDKPLCRVHVAHTGEEALNLLRKNPKIGVFISDYRLETTEGRWQPLQGYDIVQAARQDLDIPPLSCFMLTNKQSIILLQSQLTDTQSIPWYTKDDVFSKEGFNIFWNAIRNAGEKVLQQRFSFKASCWNKSTNYNRLVAC